MSTLRERVEALAAELAEDQKRLSDGSIYSQVMGGTYASVRDRLLVVLAEEDQ